jgi:nucleoside phosphorylase
VNGPTAVLVALREEEIAVERRLSRADRPILARSGIGKERAARCAEALIARERPGLLIVAGFGGAARDGLPAGSVIVASEVVEPGGAAWRAREDLVALAIREGDAGAREGRLATVDRLHGTEDEKRRVGEALGADVLDMESSGAVRAAVERGVPFVCIRVVFDEIGFELPFDPSRMLTPEGDVRPAAALREIVSHPGGILRLPALRARARAAGRALGRAVAGTVRGAAGLS